MTASLRDHFDRAISFRVLAIVTMLVSAATRVYADDSRSPSRPVIPSLIVGEPDPPLAFVVKGYVRMSDDGALGFSVATDGRRQRCAVIDAVDGTPIYLFDGERTLLYDLPNARIIVMHGQLLGVQFDWRVGEAKPLAFSFTADFGRAHQGERPADVRRSSFRIDQLAESRPPDDASEIDDAGRRLYAYRRPDAVETIAQRDDDPSAFTFTSRFADAVHDHMRLSATHIGAVVPESALAFPDLERLGDAVTVVEVKGDRLPEVARAMQGNIVVFTKLALRGEDSLRKEIDRVAAGLDWNKLLEQDEAFGSRYRAALGEQGITFESDDNGVGLNSP